jgi:hypothetical protein
MLVNGLDSSVILQRMVDAVELVRQRLLRASSALKNAEIDYAIVGGNAVAAWVATVDRAAVRNTQEVDILIRRADYEPAKRALESAGFVHRRAAGLDLFLDGKRPVLAKRSISCSPAKSSSQESLQRTQTCRSQRTWEHFVCLILTRWCESNSRHFATRIAHTCAI